jgi:predicted PurR-regulated permease PerM
MSESPRGSSAADQPVTAEPTPPATEEPTPSAPAGPTAAEPTAAQPDTRPVPATADDEERPRGDPEVAAVTSPPWHHATKNVAGVAFGIALLLAIYLARNALTLVAMSGLIAFLVAPVIRLLQRRARFPRPLALVSSYLVALALVVTFGVLTVAGIAASFAEVDPAETAETLRDTTVNALVGLRTIELGDYTLDLSDVVDPAIERLEDAAVPGQQPPDDASPEAAGGTDGEATATAGGTTFTVGGDQVNLLLGRLLSSVQVVGGLLAALVVTFVIAVYLSADSHRFHAALHAQVPPAYRRDAERIEARIGRIWRGYLYGQLLNSLATGLLVWLVLWAIGLPGAFVLGLIMMVLNMIPTFGPIIAAVPGVLAAIALGSTRLDWGTLSFTLLVIGVYVVVVQLQANLMAPFITGAAVQMAPATVLIGLIVGFQVGGLVGSLLVVPVLGTLKELARYVFAKLVDRDPFPDAATAG